MCREYLNVGFFGKIFSNPNNPLLDLLSSPGDAAIIEGLRSAHLLPIIHIHHGLIHYQPTLK